MSEDAEGGAVAMMACPACDGEGETDNPDGGHGRFLCEECGGDGEVHRDEYIRRAVLAAIIAEVDRLEGGRVDAGAYTQMLRNAEGAWLLCADASIGTEDEAWVHATALCVMRTVLLRTRARL